MVPVVGSDVNLWEVSTSAADGQSREADPIGDVALGTEVHLALGLEDGQSKARILAPLSRASAHFVARAGTPCTHSSTPMCCNVLNCFPLPPTEFFRAAGAVWAVLERQRERLRHSSRSWCRSTIVL